MDSINLRSSSSYGIHMFQVLILDHDLAPDVEDDPSHSSTHAVCRSTNDPHITTFGGR